MIVVLITIMLLNLVPAGVVLAAQAQPTDLELQEITVFENTREENDQCWMIKYFVDFDTLPDETVADLFLFRLLDTDDSEIASTTAYPYYSRGYELGIVSFYFEAADAPTWESGLTVQFTGNPLVDWTGGPPVVETSSITWHTGESADMQQLAAAHIITLASDLEAAWDVEMITSTSGVTILSDTGLAYFLNVISYLRGIAPLAIGEYIFPADYPETSPAEHQTSVTLLDRISGTILDITPMERSMGMPEGALTALIYYGACIAFLLYLANKKNVKKGLVWLADLIVIGGALIGVPFLVTIVFAFVSLISTVYVIYKGATA